MARHKKKTEKRIKNNPKHCAALKKKKKILPVS